MAGTMTVAILSDIHYASAAEIARGRDYEFQGIQNPFTRVLLKAFRHFIWLRNPLKQNDLLEAFLEQSGPVDYVVLNGDYSCDSGFVGVSDDASCQSARECLNKVRSRFDGRVLAIMGDHELGKFSLIGSRGGMRRASYDRARQDLGLDGFWQLRLGRYVLMGVASSIVALPEFLAETIPEDRGAWEELRQAHLAQIGAAFASLEPEDLVLLFCHDPTALPYLGLEESVRERLPQIEQTVVGHLHSNLVLWNSRLLAGMPTIGFLGQPVRRMTAALNRARDWKAFRVRLCPSLAGIELLKDGGYFLARLDLDGNQPVQFDFEPLASRRRTEV
jgi:hypothetical protein